MLSGRQIDEFLVPADQLRQVALNGFESAGMQKYIKWQNSVLTAAQMKSERFIEIPGLHQTCVYRKQQVYLAAPGTVLRPLAGGRGWRLQGSGCLAGRYGLLDALVRGCVTE